MLQKLVITDLANVIKDKRLLVRVDFNVPMKDGRITDETRIRSSLKTINYLKERGAKSIALMSHFGRPNGKANLKYSLKPIVPALSRLLGEQVTFLKDCIGPQVRDKISNSSDGQIFLLENLRFHSEEEGSRKEKGKKIKDSKDKIAKFRKELTQNGDIYINDAFGTSHRAHSSITGINVNLRAAGFLLKKELTFFSKVVENPQRPYLVILGGAKVQDKIQLIKNMVNRVDKMIITGGMAFTFLKEHFGMQIGSSLFDKKGAKYVKEIMDYASDKGVKLEFPVDFRVCKQFKDGQKMIPATLEDGIPNGYLGLDVGPRTIEKFRKIISQSKTIFLNGSNGVFEFKSTRPGSIALVNQVVEATKNGAISVCGGGDTVSLVNLVPGASKEISHISTGGGASIELMEGHKLPGIEYLSNKDDVSHLL